MDLIEDNQLEQYKDNQLDQNEYNQIEQNKGNQLDQNKDNQLDQNKDNQIDQNNDNQNKNNQIKQNNDQINKRRIRFIRKEIGHLYADIVIKFDQSKSSVDMDIRGLKLMILTMLKSLFGDNGAAIPCDILKFNKDKLRAYLRFPAKYLVQVRNSLTLQSNYGGQMCSVIILKICHSLSYLPLELTNQIHNIEM